jgi:hypothetical protein
MKQTDLIKTTIKIELLLDPSEFRIAVNGNPKHELAEGIKEIFENLYGTMLMSVYVEDYEYFNKPAML